MAIEGVAGVSSHLNANKWFVIGIGVILIAGFAYYYYTIEEGAKLKAVPDTGYNLGASISNFFRGLAGSTPVQNAGNETKLSMTGG